MSAQRTPMWRMAARQSLGTRLSCFIALIVIGVVTSVAYLGCARSNSTSSRLMDSAPWGTIGRGWRRQRTLPLDRKIFATACTTSSPPIRDRRDLDHEADSTGHLRWSRAHDGRARRSGGARGACADGPGRDQRSRHAESRSHCRCHDGRILRSLSPSASRVSSNAAPRLRVALGFAVRPSCS